MCLLVSVRVFVRVCMCVLVCECVHVRVRVKEQEREKLISQYFLILSSFQVKQSSFLLFFERTHKGKNDTNNKPLPCLLFHFRRSSVQTLLALTDSTKTYDLHRKSTMLILNL